VPARVRGRDGDRHGLDAGVRRPELGEEHIRGAILGARKPHGGGLNSCSEADRERAEPDFGRGEGEATGFLATRICSTGTASGR